MDVESLKVICDTVVGLTKLRQKECKHLCVENFAQECFGRLLSELKEYQDVKINSIKYTFKGNVFVKHRPDKLKAPVMFPLAKGETIIFKGTPIKSSDGKEIFKIKITGE